MDTLTHALSGALLARALTRSGPARRGGTSERWLGAPVPVGHAVAVGFFAAAFPDVDFALRFVSDLAYLRGHRGVTHSIVILPLWALLLGALFALVARRRAAWKRDAWLSAAGIGIHIAGDWITQFGTMLLAPLSAARFGLGATFIIDLVVSGIVLAGLVASAVLRHSRAPAFIALALLPAWVGLSYSAKQDAIAFAREYAAREGLRVEFVDAAPRPASPFNWTVLVFDGERYHVAHVNTRRTEPLVAAPDDHFIRRYSAPYQPLAQARWERLPMFGGAADEALAREVWAHPDFAFFRWFAMYPLVERIDNGPRETCVWYRDLRFVLPGRDAAPFRYGMCRGGGGAWTPYAFDDTLGRTLVR
ncbi:MAG: metal-dependent hydrolase [Pseudomonadota bacterium]